MGKKTFFLVLFLKLSIGSLYASSFFPSRLNYTAYAAPTVVFLKHRSKNLQMLFPKHSHLGYVLGVRGGLSFDKSLFLEIDCSYQKADLSTEKRQNHLVKKNGFQSWSCLINNLYYFSPNQGIIPYIGLGIGYRQSKMVAYRYTLDYSLHTKAKFIDHAPAYQVLGGLTCCLFEATHLSLETLVQHGLKESFILSLQIGLSLLHQF